MELTLPCQQVAHASSAVWWPRTVSVGVELDLCGPSKEGNLLYSLRVFCLWASVSFSRTSSQWSVKNLFSFQWTCCPPEWDTNDTRPAENVVKLPSRSPGGVLSWVRLWWSWGHRAGHLSASGEQPGVTWKMKREMFHCGKEGKKLPLDPLPSVQPISWKSQNKPVRPPTRAGGDTGPVSWVFAE